MMTDFYDSFGEEADANTQIPQEILLELNKDLPENLMYIQDCNGKCKVVPRHNRSSKEIRASVQFDLHPDKDAALIARLKLLPREKLPEYLYRSQQSLPVKNMNIGDQQKKIPLEQVYGNPLSDQRTVIEECRMFPAAFPPPISLLFENAQGDRVSVQLQQQAYDSLTEIKFSNINFPALKMELYIYDPLAEDCGDETHTSKDIPSCATYSVTPTKAATVSEALRALRIFESLSDGTVKVNGKTMTSKTLAPDFDTQKIQEALDFWTIAATIEEKLGVRFQPGADFPIEDVRFFSELNICLNEKKSIIWKHPFDHFHVDGFEPAVASVDPEKLANKEALYIRFMEGPIAATLLGTKFELYSFTEMNHFVVTNIQWDDSRQKSGEVYITDAPGKAWTLKRLYMTREEAELFNLVRT